MDVDPLPLLIARRVVSPAGVLLFHPLPVGTAGHFFNPFVVLQIPGDGLTNAALKSFLRTPLQFAFDLSRVDGIAPIVSGTIFHKRDEAPMWSDRVTWTKFVEQRANRFHDFQICFFIPPADVIRLPDASSRENCA